MSGIALGLGDIAPKVVTSESNASIRCVRSRGSSERNRMFRARLKKRRVCQDSFGFGCPSTGRFYLVRHGISIWNGPIYGIDYRAGWFGGSTDAGVTGYCTRLSYRSHRFLAPEPDAFHLGSNGNRALG